MKCRRAFDADLTAVVRGEAADADFAAHVATCAECAAEVGVWAELDAMLRASAPPDVDHPEPETLVAFVDAPASLAASTRAGVERHLAGCRVCADEARALRRFDAVQAAIVARPEPDASRGGIMRVVWHPAFAYALVAVLLLPVLRDQLGRFSAPSRVTEVAREESRQAPESSSPPPAAAPPALIPAPPLAESNDRGAGAGGFHDQLGATASRRARDASAAAMEKSKAPAAADTDGRVDAAQPAAPAEIDRRERRPLAPGIGAAAKPEAAPAARARGAVVPGAAPEPESDVDASATRAGAPAASARAPGAPAPPVVIDLGSNEPTLASSALADRAVRLRVVPPPELGPGSLAVRVRDRSGTREIATRAAYRADAIVIEIPAGWLVPGDYVVTLAPLAATREKRTLNLAFRVAGPGAPR